METSLSALLLRNISTWYPQEKEASNSYACSSTGPCDQNFSSNSSPVALYEDQKHQITKTARLSLSRLSPIFSPEATPRPERRLVADPATHLPSHVIEVVRDEDGKFKSNFPRSWQDLGPLVYMWISEDEKILIGSSIDFEGRFANYLTGFRGKGASCHLSLPRAVQAGMRVWVGIAMVCSNTITMKQNETSLIAQKRLAGYALHNVTFGEGDPTILLGSPTADGKGGEIPSKLASRPPVEIDRTRPIEDIGNWTPKRYIPVTLNEEGKIGIRLPKSWKHISSCIYVFKIEEKRIIGETGRPIRKRVSEYISSFNGTGASGYQPFPRAVRKALNKGKRVSFSIIGVCSPVATLRKQFESYFIVSKDSLVSKNGWNQRLDASPSLPPRQLYQVPSPSPQASKRAQPSFSQAAAESFTVEDTADISSDLPAHSPMADRLPLMHLRSGVRTRGMRQKLVARTLDFDSLVDQAAPLPIFGEQASKPKILPWYNQENLISGEGDFISQHFQPL